MKTMKETSLKKCFWISRAANLVTDFQKAVLIEITIQLTHLDHLCFTMIEFKFSFKPANVYSKFSQEGVPLTSIIFHILYKELELSTNSL